MMQSRMHASHLAVQRKQRRTSLNQTAIDVLGEAHVVSGTRRNDLVRLAGTWSKAQLLEFRKATRAFEAVDPELWR